VQIFINEEINMKGFKSSIESDTLENNNFRNVLYTSKHIQLVLMSLKAGKEIGEEIHYDNDQFFRFEQGTGKCVVDGNSYNVEDGDALVVPAGANHNIINTGSDTELKMYTIYSPPHHKDGIVRATKNDAEENGAEFDGTTTEEMSDFEPDLKGKVREEVSKLETKVFNKIGRVKSKRIKNKLTKNANKIAKYESKIEKLTAKMTKLQHSKAV
jgi:mannose-6-phosphate isomerase-like protein (cupin superfamily)